jgi:hypothetical protein
MFKFKRPLRVLRQFLIVSLFFFPFTYVAMQLKEGTFRQGDKFFVLNPEAALLIAAGFSLLITIWNALEYEKFKNLADDQYLTPRQRYEVNLRSDLSIDQVLEILGNGLLIKKRWLLVHSDERQIQLSYRFYLTGRDKVIISKQANSWYIESKPKNKMWFIDFGRNYSHIVKITGEILKSEQYKND